MRGKQLYSWMALTFCAACMMAANQQSLPENWPVLASYGYWIIRLSIQSALFIAFLQLTNLIPFFRRQLALALGLACLASYVPYVLSVTAMDIVLGFPELGATAGAVWDPNPRFNAFLLELGYLLDDHIFFCALLATPVMFLPDATTSFGPFENIETTEPKLSPKNDTDAHQLFFDSLSPPLTGSLIRAEAQEHYVKLVSAEETRMVLYRFSDVLRELPETLGMQVHRSHWIAKDAIKDVYKKGGNTRIVTRDGSEIPVSRRYVSHVSGWLDQNGIPAQSGQ